MPQSHRGRVARSQIETIPGAQSSRQSSCRWTEDPFAKTFRALGQLTSDCLAISSVAGDHGTERWFVNPSELARLRHRDRLKWRQEIWISAPKGDLYAVLSVCHSVARSPDCGRLCRVPHVSLLRHGFGVPLRLSCGPSIDPPKKSPLDLTHYQTPP